jgi:hypothetical protein
VVKRRGGGRAGACVSACVVECACRAAAPAAAAGRRAAAQARAQWWRALQHSSAPTRSLARPNCPHGLRPTCMAGAHLEDLFVVVALLEALHGRQGLAAVPGDRARGRGPPGQATGSLPRRVRAGCGRSGNGDVSARAAGPPPPGASGPAVPGHGGRCDRYRPHHGCTLAKFQGKSALRGSPQALGASARLPSPPPRKKHAERVARPNPAPRSFSSTFPHRCWMRTCT